MKVVVEGTKSDGEKFKKEIETDIEKLNLSWNYLSFINLSPHKKCTELRELTLSHNRLVAVDLSPLEKCTELQTLELASSTTIRWESPNLDNAKLPKGLQEYQEEIQQAWEEFTKPEEDLPSDN